MKVKSVIAFSGLFALHQYEFSPHLVKSKTPPATANHSALKRTAFPHGEDCLPKAYMPLYVCVFVHVLSAQVFVEVNPLIIASPFGQNACLSTRIADISLLRKANHEQCSKYGTMYVFSIKKYPQATRPIFMVLAS